MLPAAARTRISPEPVRTPGTVDSTFSLFLIKFPEPLELDPLTGPEQGLCTSIHSRSLCCQRCHLHQRAVWSITSSRTRKLLKISAVDLHKTANFSAPGIFWIMAKMVRRTCAFCSEGEAGSVMYIAKERNVAAHQDCLLFSSGFVESEEYNPDNLDLRFDVASVLKELKRGKRLVCNFCRKKGATVGCEERACRRSYHYFCALCDDAAIETDEVNGVYRVFCPKHDPGDRTNRYGAISKRRRHTLKSSTITEQMSTEDTAEDDSLRILARKNNRHKVQIDFVRKCKQAGLLDDIFEEMLDTLHLAQEKLMDDNTSETASQKDQLSGNNKTLLREKSLKYEETVMSLFDCGLFENILTNIHSGTEEKIRELMESRKRLDNKIELLQDLKEAVLPPQENTASTSSTMSE